MGVVIPNRLSSIDQISPHWLQSVFSESGKTVPAIRNVRTEPIGAGNSGITVKVLIEYENPGFEAPGSVVCKFHSDDETRSESVKAAGVFLTESNAQKLLAEHSEASIPECYFAEASDDGGEFNLVCEDLSVHCELGDQIKGCTIEEARVAILELASLHRQFWNESQLNELTWIRPRMPLPPDVFELLQERLKKLLTEEQQDIVRQATPRILDWLALTPENQTLIHVDCRVDNVLFDQSDHGSPRAYLIDFALVTIGDAVADVAYFLTSSLSPEDRLACELHTSEIAQKDSTWTIEKAAEAYRVNIVSSLYLTMFAAMGMPDESQANLLLTRLFERNCAAVKHWMKL